jgi:hypothetical protein
VLGSDVLPLLLMRLLLLLMMMMMMMMMMVRLHLANPSCRPVLPKSAPLNLLLPLCSTTSSTFPSSSPSFSNAVSQKAGALRCASRGKKR